MLYTTHDEMFNATQQTQSYAHFQFVSVSIAAHMLTEYWKKNVSQSTRMWFSNITAVEFECMFL